MHWLCYIIFVLVCQYLNQAQDIDFETIEVMLNESANLPCSVKIPGADKITLVIWYKNGSSVPIYSVDMRERYKPEHADHWSDKKIMGGRAFYNFDQRSLLIEKVQLSDDGVYKCRVDFKQTPTQNFEVKLMVAVAIQNLTIVEAIKTFSKSELANYSLPAIQEGASLTATCIAFGGNPKPTVTWWQKSELIDDTYETNGDKVKNILWLDRLQRKNVDEVLTCKAENSKLTPSMAKSVSINMYLGPEEIRFLGENKEMTAGHQYDITCQSKGSRPPANITWYKDTTILKEPTRYSISPDKNYVISVLTYTPEVNDSGVTLSCEASNDFVPHDRRKDFWTLKVKYAPIVSLNLGRNLNPSLIREGTDVYFECLVQADPWIKRIRWLHNNKQVSSNQSTGIIFSNQTLVLQSISRHSSGYYRCAALNTEGESVSQPFNLDVKYEPVCRLNQQRVYGAARNEEIHIGCLIDANPAPTSFHWSFNNSMVHIVSVNNFKVENGSSMLLYKPSSETHYGTLLCTSQNELGQQAVPCIFHIVSAGRPEMPRNCTIANMTQTGMHVKCERGFDGGLPQEFVCEVRRLKKLVSNVTSKSEPEFRLSGLEPGTTYRINIYATNIKGNSKEYIMMNVSTLAEVSLQPRRSIDSTTALLKSDWNTQLVIILGSVLLIAVMLSTLMVKVLVGKCRKKRRATNEIRKNQQLSQHSLSHSDDDRNPDLIPQQNTISDIRGPTISSISVETSTSENDLSMLPMWENPITNNRVPTLLEANRLEDLVWTNTTKWPKSIEPIMVVLPEPMPVVMKQNAQTQTSSPQNRKESAV